MRQDPWRANDVVGSHWYVRDIVLPSVCPLDEVSESPSIVFADLSSSVLRLFHSIAGEGMQRGRMLLEQSQLHSVFNVAIDKGEDRSLEQSVQNWSQLALLQYEEAQMKLEGA